MWKRTYSGGGSALCWVKVKKGLSQETEDAYRIFTSDELVADVGQREGLERVGQIDGVVHGERERTSISMGDDLCQWHQRCRRELDKARRSGAELAAALALALALMHSKQASRQAVTCINITYMSSTSTFSSSSFTSQNAAL
jgi:hypothetical protein